MRKILRYSALLALLLLGLSGMAQDRECASHEVYQQMLLTDPQFGLNQQRIEQFTQEYVKKRAAKQLQNLALPTVITIPVVFHVLYSNVDENISDARIQAQLKVMNDDFRKLNDDWSKTPAVYAGRVADVQIQFCLAQRDPNGNATTGIVRKATNKASFSSNNAIKFDSQGGSDAWPRDQYLNFWVGDLGRSLLGYAQFPGGTAATDGVVCHYNSVGGPDEPGGFTNYGIGRTATHEIGHWLNLRHIWGDGTCANDFVDDTPAHPSSNGGCPSATLTTSCAQNPGALMMWMNYMDYSYDQCLYMFTEGQKTRMRAIFEPGGARAALLNSQGCVAPGGGGTCAVPTGLATNSISETGATLTWTSVNGANSYDVQYNEIGGLPATANSTTNNLALSGLTANTTYEFKVRANCSGSSSAYSSSQTFTTLGGGGGCSGAYEPNNSTGTATVLTLPADIDAGISSNTDLDYFRVSTSRTAPNLQVSLSNLPADYDVQLLNNKGQVLAQGTAAGTGDEIIVYNSSRQGNYYIRVFGKNGAFDASSCYRLQAISSATPFRISDEGASRLIVAAQAVRMFPNPAQGELTLVFGTGWKGTAQVTMTDMLGRNVLARQVVSGAAARLPLTTLNSGIYLVKVTNGELLTTHKIMIRQ